MNSQIACTRTIERRRNNRRQISAPVFFFWKPQNGPPQSSDGMTRDVNSNGVYVNARETPPVGELVQMDILLPNPVRGVSEMHLTGEGLVLRVVPDSGSSVDDSGCGFAVSMRFHPQLSEWVLSYLKDSGEVE